MAALCAMAALFLIPAFVIPSPTPDWPSFYAGAKLAPEGSARLYSFAASQAITGRFMNAAWVWAFVRPPVYATALYPLGLLTPRAAFIAWQTLNLAALVCVVVLLWPSRVAVAATLSCAPMWTSFRQGQDMPLIALAAALSITLAERKRNYLAGLVLALCGIKFHLLLLIPTFLCVRKAWSVAAGLLTGAGSMIGACFVLYGASWIHDYYRCVVENQKHLKTTSLLAVVPSPWWAAVVCLAAGVVTVVLCRHSKTDGMALAVTLATGLMVAPRFYLYDVAIALPAALVVLRQFTNSPAAVNLPHSTLGLRRPMLHKSHTMADESHVVSCV
jgi:Glycosyltransferase family 87